MTYYEHLAERLGGRRILNRSGTFNIHRTVGRAWSSANLYHTLLNLSWPRFFLLAAGAYFLTNILFATIFFSMGPDALENIHTGSIVEHFSDAYFFSVQTLATIGYGKIVPRTPLANFMVSIAALVGLLSFAFMTGLLFARFSRPMAVLTFSDNAVIAPFQSGRALMFRLANKRSNELTDVGAMVSLTRWETTNGKRARKFHQLTLERERVTFLPWHWVVVHPIDERSPLWGISRDDFFASEPEVLILMTAMDETFSQVVHTRSSYHEREIVWGARFKPMFDPSDPNAGLEIDLSRLHEIEPTE